MSSLFAEHVLLPSGWARDVCLEIDAGGWIASIEPNAEPGGAPRAAGPVIPGLPNLHSHAFQRAMAGLAETRGSGDGVDDFWTWRAAMYQLVERTTPEHMHAIAARLYVELLRGGFTSVAEFHYLHNAPNGEAYDDPAETSIQVVEAARRTGIGITHLPVLYGRAGFSDEPLGTAQQRFRSDADSVAAITGRLREMFAGEAGVRTGLAPHSLRAASDEEIARAVANLHATDEDAPVHIHVAEQAAEVEECVASTGQTPVERLLEHHAVDSRWCLVHATHMTESETDGLATSGAVAGLCPTTEANLGDGVFPLPRFLEHGGRFGVGTDSHVGRSAPAELRWLEYGQRLVRQRRCLASSKQRPSVGRTLWDGAVSGGASALARQVDGLAVGQRADFLVLDVESPDLGGLSGDTLLDALVFSGGRRCVRDVFVGGHRVIEEGRHPEEVEISEAYRKALAELRQ